MSEQRHPSTVSPWASRRRFLKSAALLTGGTVLGTRSASGQQVTAITSWHELEAVRDASAENYTLAADLTAGSPGHIDWVRNRDGGWQPISSFSGVFSGDGHKIADLVIDREDAAGLFEANRGVIEDVGLDNCVVSGGTDVGTLVGRNTGTVRCANARGAVSGRQAVGGLVGTNDGTEGDGTILNSAANCTVNGQINIGGLVGTTGGETTVRRSAASGAVNGSNVSGGLIGRAKGATVDLSFATGSVTAGAPGVGGGLIGVAADSQGTTETTVRQTFATGDLFGALVGGLIAGGAATIDDSFATGSVAGQLSAGGLVGGTVSKISNSYWDTESSGVDVGIGDADDTGVTGLETATMQGEAARRHMDALDFTETWTPTTTPPAYPTFQWRSETCPTGRITATEEDSQASDQPDVSDESGPGFGVAGALVGLSATAYLLGRRNKND